MNSFNYYNNPYVMVLLYYRCGIWETKKLSNLDKVILPWLKMARPGVNSSTPCNFVCSVTQSCPTLQPPDCSTPGFPVLHHLPELAQTQVHWVSDTIQSSHPLCVPFSSCLQSFPESESFPMSQFFVSGGQSIGKKCLHTCSQLQLVIILSFISALYTW